MSMFRLTPYHIYLIVIILFLISLVIYFNYLNPQTRAARHLAEVHKAVTEMHPAILNKDAKAFHAWHSIAYEKTKSFLPKVHSVADENALLNFYFAGYEDAHLSGVISKSPFAWMDFESSYWAGWLAKATTNGFEVVMTLGGEDYPPLGSYLIRCNQQSIDEFLKNNIAPFIDKRWPLLAAKDKSLMLLSMDTPYKHLLVRPSLSSCDFKTQSDGVKPFKFQWSLFRKDNEKEFSKIYYHGYEYPSVYEFAPKSYWINVSDFNLYSAEAYQHHQRLLSDLKALKDVDLIVFDTRMNDGGISSFGDEILKAFFGQKKLDYLWQQLGKKVPENDAIFRASWRFYWAYDFMYKQQEARQGNDSIGLKFLAAILARTKQALENNQETFLQSELGFGGHEILHENHQEWQSKEKVVLLTSRNCFSSCLNFVDTLKQVPGLIHLGEPTNGDTIYTQIAETVSSYLHEDYLFMVPIKAFKSRWREDNQPHIVDVIYGGNIYADRLEDWVLEQVKMRQ